jgi:hypothetical protein
MPATAAQTIPPPGRLRPIRQAADAYGLDPYTIRRWISAGLISSYRVGLKLIMVDLDEVNARMVRRVSSARGQQEAGQ